MGRREQRHYSCEHHIPCSAENIEIWDQTVKSFRERLFFLTIPYYPTQPSPGTLSSPVLYKFPSQQNLETLGQVISKSLNSQSFIVTNENYLGFYAHLQTISHITENRITRVFCDRIPDETLSAVSHVTRRIWTGTGWTEKRTAKWWKVEPSRIRAGQGEFFLSRDRNVTLFLVTLGHFRGAWQTKVSIINLLRWLRRPSTYYFC